MEKVLFSLPLYIYEVDDWENKKKEIVGWRNKTKFSRSTADNHFNTDRLHLQQNKFYSEDFVKLVDNELQLFRQEADLETIFISDIWFVEYENSDYHSPHTHESARFSGILYVNLDDKNPMTTFVQPWYSYWGTKQMTVEVKEGTMLIVPSHVMHFSRPNASVNTKTVLSFDMRT